MIFEFVGLPATGKTTILNELHAANSAERLYVYTKKEIIGWFFFGTLIHPVITIQGLYLVFRYRPTLYVFWNYFVVRYARVYKADWYSKTNWIIDEPPVQNTYSLMKKEYSLKHLNKIYRWSFSPGHVIFFDLPENDRLKRRELRNRNMPNEFDEGWNQRTKKSDVFLRTQLEARESATIVSGPTFDAVNQVIKKHVT